MIAAVDVYYGQAGAQAACVLFHDWSDEQPALELTSVVAEVAPYRPGQFFLRELPPVLAILGRVPATPGCVIVDAHVWLSQASTRSEARPGLGARLFVALEERVPVVGVAKNAFRGADVAPVLRGRSQRPLYVSSIGMSRELAAERVRSMHGPHRIPTLLARVDWLSRHPPLPSG